MKPPVIILAIGTAVMFIVAIATGSKAKSDADLTFIDSDYAVKAANLASASNVSLALGGTGIVGLLVVWALFEMLTSRSAAAMAPDAEERPSAIADEGALP